MAFDLLYDCDWITVQLPPPAGLRRLLTRDRTGSVEALAEANRDFALAIAEIRTIAESDSEAMRIDEDAVRMRHRIAAALDARSAETLGLPPLVHLTFKTDVEGALGSPSFRLRYRWLKFGREQNPRRVGAILHTEDGDRRLPLWLLDAVELSERFERSTDLAAHWEALARFRQLLEPALETALEPTATEVSMTDFLQDLQVGLADSFGVATWPDSEKLLDFDPVPYSGRSLEGIPEQEVSEAHGELHGTALQRFQERFRARGALPAYRVGDNSYLVVDRSAQTALEVMSRKQRARPTERDAFVRNPRAAIAEAMTAKLGEFGDLEGLAPEGEEEAIEAMAIPTFVETVEYSARVIGTTTYEDPELELPAVAFTNWFPENFGASEIEAMQYKDRTDADDGPVILDTKQNFYNLGWIPDLAPRDGPLHKGVPAGVVTALQDHQRDGLEWQKECWSAGLPGVLNADEQGLGKTLQTIAFLRAVQDHGAQTMSGTSGPTLVVAPTSLLPTWEAEVGKHTDRQGLGHVLRLFGSDLGGFKATGTAGVDIESGLSKLDLSFLEEEIAAGRGHRFWLLTTYTTLTNYHHSLARVPFSVAVFDEIQALKNPGSLRSFAARAIRADFRIGLTGTPIENRAADIWAVMDQLAPGALGTLEEFNDRYSQPEPATMSELHSRVFLPVGGRPQLALRRTKEQAAGHLPRKTRRLHPRLMPQSQMEAYDAARLKLSGGNARLKALHHIRSASVHPDLALRRPDSDFVRDSARIEATFDLIREIRDRGERALIFIEHRLVQYQFVEIARREFGLQRIDIINGSTPIRQRQSIVARFQRHLIDDGGFDLLVLGTRAAGTGLTLTAATHVIHVSRWWNPAVEEQCNDRVHRIGQTTEVSVHVPMAVHPEYREHSFDCLLHSLMNRKRKLAHTALWPMGDTDSDVAGLQEGVAMGADAPPLADSVDPVVAALTATFARDGKSTPKFARDGSVEYD